MRGRALLRMRGKLGTGTERVVGRQRRVRHSRRAACVCTIAGGASCREVCQLCANYRPALSPVLTTRYQGRSPRLHRREPHMHRALALVLLRPPRGGRRLRRAVRARRVAGRSRRVRSSPAAATPVRRSRTTSSSSSTAGRPPSAWSGWSVQYASATGTSWQVTVLAGWARRRGATISSSSRPAARSAPDSTPDATGTSNLAVSGGKVAVVRSATALTCGATAGSCSAVTSVADLVGYGGATDFEGAVARAIDNTTAATRAADGCVDTDANGADFTSAAAAPENRRVPPSRAARSRRRRAARRRARRSTSTSSQCCRSRSSVRRSASATRRRAAPPTPSPSGSP